MSEGTGTRIAIDGPQCSPQASRRDILMGAGGAAMIAGAGLTPAGASAVAAQARPAATMKPRPFDMADVDLGEGPFLHAQRMTEAYLLRLQPDRMLHNFRVNAGLKPGARPLEFTIAAADGSSVRLIPYHRIAHERYATYWKLSPEPA